MRKSDQTKHSVTNEGSSNVRSIFPPFKVNVPMPAGTAVPPTVVVTPNPSAGTAKSGTANQGK